MCDSVCFPLHKSMTQIFYLYLGTFSQLKKAFSAFNESIPHIRNHPIKLFFRILPIDGTGRNGQTPCDVTQKAFGFLMRKLKLQLQGIEGWTINKDWKHLKAAWNSTRLKLIRWRRELKEKINISYELKRQEGQKNIRKERSQLERLARQAEVAATQRNMKELYNITRKLSGTYLHTNKPIMDKHGLLFSTQEAQPDRCLKK